MMRNNEMQTDRAIEGAHARMAQAWQWLCEQRSTAPDGADVWHIRWEKLNRGEGWLTALTHQLLRGDYRLTPLQLQGQNENRKAVWGAQDALVLKWVALRLPHQLPLHPSCEHVTGHGGGKQSIEKLHHLLTGNTDAHEKKTDDSNTRGYTWGCRTDIRGYYRNINKQTLIGQVQQHVQNPVLRDLVHQYIHYTVEDGGTFHTPDKGISRGCPLSPLMGALHLVDMDEHFSQQPNIHYARYMDDVIILARTRWQLRKHTKRLMQWFGEYGFEAHPDKTQIGRTAKGFDWMGAWLTHEGVTDIAPRAKANHREKVRRLYEQLARLPKWKRKSAAPQVHARVSRYRTRWNIWAGSLLGLFACGSLPCMSADRPIYVLSTILPSGAVLPGGDFMSVGTVGPTTVTNNEVFQDDSVLNLVADAVNNADVVPGSTISGLTFGKPIPSTPWYGLYAANRDLYLIPASGYLRVGYSSSDFTQVYVDPTKKNGLDCQSLTGIGSAKTVCRDSYYLFLAAGKSFGNAGSYSNGNGYYANWTIAWRPIAGANISAGTVAMPDLVMWQWPRKSSARVDKPTSIVIVGLTCTLASTKNGMYSFDTPDTSASTGVLLAGLTSADLGLTANCQGSNNTQVNVPIAYTLNPGGGGAMKSGGKGLVVSGQPSFYMNFTNDGIPDCNESKSTAIPLDGLTSQRIAMVAPAKNLPTTPVTLGAALCSTGNATQPPGVYSMIVTASIVSY